MKKSIQIRFLEIAHYISIKCPYNLENIKEFRLLGGQYDKDNQRWLLPKNDVSWRKLDEMFGTESCSAVARVTPKDLTAAGSQAKHGGYLVANWDERKNCISLPEGVALVAGAWDDAASRAEMTPCLSGPDAVLHVVVRRDYADTHGLPVVEELPADVVDNPLAAYADSDLQTELENRGYIVTRPRRRQY